jgi:hypothetical protein
LEIVGKDGVSGREALERLLRRKLPEEKRAKYEAELAGPPPPVALAHLWQAFVRLSRRRGGSGFGPAPIGWGDLDAFMRLTGTRLSSWEVEIIEALDDLWRKPRT